MPRPKTKDELLRLSQKNYSKLIDFVDFYPKKEQLSEFPKGYLNRNIRDVLAHLHHWHLMFVSWYEIGMNGGKPDMPAKGYTWKTMPDLNLKIQEKYTYKTPEDVRKMLNGSFNSIQKIINGHTEEELFTKKKYGWTGTTSLGAYLISTTSSHYDWAYKLIKKSKKIR